MVNEAMMTALTTSESGNTVFTTPKHWSDFDICEMFSITHGTWGAYLAMFLCIIGLISNAVLLYTITKSMVLQGAPGNTFLTSIGVGNLLMLLLVGPAYIKHEFQLCWDLGVSACKFYAFAEVMTMSAIAFSLVAISYEWYRTATGKKEMDSKMRLMVLACIWGCAVIIATPTTFLADIAFDNFCYVRPHFEPRGKVYIICQFLCVYMCPSAYNITVRIWGKFINRVEQSSDVPHHTPKQLNNATAIMCGTVIIAWMPFYVFAVGLEFQSLPFGNWKVISNLYDAQYIMLFFNCALSPFILWAFSGMHRAALMGDALCGAKCCGGRQTGDRYSSFRNEFDLDGGGANTDQLTRVEYSPEYDEDSVQVTPNNV